MLKYRQRRTFDRMNLGEIVEGFVDGSASPPIGKSSDSKDDAVALKKRARAERVRKWLDSIGVYTKVPDVIYPMLDPLCRADLRLMRLLVFFGARRAAITQLMNISERALKRYLKRRSLSSTSREAVEVHLSNMKDAAQGLDAMLTELKTRHASVRRKVNAAVFRAIRDEPVGNVESLLKDIRKVTSDCQIDAGRIQFTVSESLQMMTGLSLELEIRAAEAARPAARSIELGSPEQELPNRPARSGPERFSLEYGMKHVENEEVPEDLDPHEDKRKGKEPEEIDKRKGKEPEEIDERKEEESRPVITGDMLSMKNSHRLLPDGIVDYRLRLFNDSREPLRDMEIALSLPGSPVEWLDPGDGRIGPVTLPPGEHLDQDFRFKPENAGRMMVEGHVSIGREGQMIPARSMDPGMVFAEFLFSRAPVSVSEFRDTSLKSMKNAVERTEDHSLLSHGFGIKFPSIGPRQVLEAIHRDMTMLTPVHSSIDPESGVGTLYYAVDSDFSESRLGMSVAARGAGQDSVVAFHLWAMDMSGGQPGSRPEDLRKSFDDFRGYVTRSLKYTAMGRDPAISPTGIGDGSWLTLTADSLRSSMASGSSGVSRKRKHHREIEVVRDGKSGLKSDSPGSRVSRIESAVTRPEPEPGNNEGPGVAVDLNDIIEEVRRDVFMQAPPGDSSFKCDRLPMLKGPRTGLRQVFSTLVNNGFTHNESDSPRVDIRCYTMPEGYCFMVRDNGTGIAPEYHERIFQDPRELPGVEGADNGPNGSGAGLPALKRIVEGLGGTVGVESAMGKGSTFYFTLPSSQSGSPM